MGMGVALAIVLIAVALTYWNPLRRVRSALGVDHLMATGHVFLVIGFVLGLLLGEREASFTDDLSPIVALVAGWVGFATGMRFDLRVLRTVPGRAYALALLPAVVAALVVGGAGGGVLLFFGVGTIEAAAGALVIAAAAASSGPTLVATIRAGRARRSSKARPVLRMIEFAAGIDDLAVVLLAMLAFTLFRASPEPIGPGLLAAAAIGGGVLLGAVTWLFLGGKAGQDERLLLGLGTLAFIAGFAGWLHLSPAALAAIAAMVLVNLPGQRMDQLLEAVRRVERPAVVVLMVVIGFHAAGPINWTFLPLVAALTVVRQLTKRASGNLVAGVRAPGPDLSTERRWGDGLVPQGILGMMVALSFFYVWRDDVSRTVLTAVATASLLNEIVAPLLYVRLLRGIEESATETPEETA